MWGVSTSSLLHFSPLMAAILPSVLIVPSVLHHLPSLPFYSPLPHPPPSAILCTTATIIIGAETHKTVLTAVTTMHMLTHIFQGQPGCTRSAQVTFKCAHIFEHNKGTKVDFNQANVEKTSNHIDFLWFSITSSQTLVTSTDYNHFRVSHKLSLASGLYDLWCN